MDTVRVRVASCLVCRRKLSIDELVDVALGTNYAKDFDLHLVDVDDVISPTVKLSDDKRRALFLSRFLLKNSLHFGVCEIISSQKLVGSLDKMTTVNLGRQH